VPIRRSIQRDRLTCLICGKRQKMLRRHLGVAHGLTPGEYRTLRPEADYPMVAPSYGEARRTRARWLGGLRKRPPRSAADRRRNRVSRRPVYVSLSGRLGGPGEIAYLACRRASEQWRSLAARSRKRTPFAVPAFCRVELGAVRCSKSRSTSGIPFTSLLELPSKLSSTTSAGPSQPPPFP
jgi:hypothetical protein